MLQNARACWSRAFNARKRVRCDPVVRGPVKWATHFAPAKWCDPFPASSNVSLSSPREGSFSCPLALALRADGGFELRSTSHGWIALALRACAARALHVSQITAEARPRFARASLRRDRRGRGGGVSEERVRARCRTPAVVGRFARSPSSVGFTMITRFTKVAANPFPGVERSSDKKRRRSATTRVRAPLLPKTSATSAISAQRSAREARASLRG